MPSESWGGTEIQMPVPGRQPKIAQKLNRRAEIGRLRIVEPKKSQVLSQRNQEEQIYLDHQATTPIDPRVLESMMPYFVEEYGNPHSAMHEYGRRAESAVRHALADIAESIGALPEDVVTTSGATEANNLALIGIAEGGGGRSPKFISVSIEHPSVLKPLSRLTSRGFEVAILSVGIDGRIDFGRLEEELHRGPALVSVAAANNEIGVLQLLPEIGELCRRYGSLLHTDASQAVGKVPLDIYSMGIDMVTLSGHKTYGPKGIGALVATAECRRLLAPQMLGGDQQGGLRGGTVPVPLCVGLGMACRIASAEMEQEALRLAHLRDRLFNALATQAGGIAVNGSPIWRLPGSLNLRVDGVDAHQLIAMVPGVAMSTGSACASSGGHPSYVLKELGLSDDEVRSSVRIGLGRFTTVENVDKAVELLATAISKIRSRRSSG